MNFREYQQKARSTAIYPAQSQIIYPTIKLAGEVGEVSELVGKWLRDEQSHNMSQERRDKLSRELGDVLWYIANLAYDLGFNLQDIAEENIAKLSDRQKRGVLGGDGGDR